MTQLPARGNSERGYTISRIFDASPEAVWKVLSKPDVWAQWSGTPGSRWSELLMDVRRGGSWRGTLREPEGREIPWRARFRDVAAPELLIFEFTSQRGAVDTFERVTIKLDDLGGKTAMSLRQSGNLTEDEYVVTKQRAFTFLDHLHTMVDAP